MVETGFGYLPTRSEAKGSARKKRAWIFKATNDSFYSRRAMLKRHRRRRKAPTCARSKRAFAHVAHRNSSGGIGACRKLSFLLFNSLSHRRPPPRPPPRHPRGARPRSFHFVSRFMERVPLAGWPRKERVIYKRIIIDEKSMWFIAK